MIRPRQGHSLQPDACLAAAEVAEQALAEARRDLGPIRLLLGFDCILRRLELERTGLKASLARLLAQENVVGFNITGVALGSVAC